MPSLSMGPIKPRTTPGWQMFHRYNVETDAFELIVRLVGHDGQRYAVLPFVIEKVPSPVPVPPALSTSRPEADAGQDVDGFLQAALDLAWEIGLRPAGFEDHTNELKAVRDHLRDMRKIAKVPGA